MVKQATQVKLPTLASQYKVLKVVKIPKQKISGRGGSCKSHCTPFNDCAKNTINSELIKIFQVQIFGVMQLDKIPMAFCDKT